MATLHIVNKSPQQPFLENCLRVAADNDGILLIEDGVYAADEHYTGLFADKKSKIFVLENDVKARGLFDRLNQNIEILTDAGFVEKVVEYSKSHSWY